ncbi:ETX/MTX2 family pore-forming toxin [Clostridium botulinum C]|uniref:Epsilon-toxin type B n=3 Tax=Clostridium botulinum TaxID=1491 RepID=C4B693_CLOBO|nr:MULTISPECIES: ETX/MTX2 family pore-forming toxin [Clostridium]MBO3442924.1 ETX/MTX2 family pore-forming toxin [Clostridium haemolyticum]MCD3195255.1 ETX/MTX2 family pore-forming toxin [Clostridium botulinum C]ACT33697.1 putative epsilon-toxin type B [Clostridium botulinum D str. 1873]KEI06355.1 putative epsilon-toxin type B [Clostridium sp. K25]MCD3200594.1 ETX/MTX2 family pore-forming toxin [Clostridium botulinum C]
MIQDFSEEYLKLVESYCKKLVVESLDFKKFTIQSQVYNDLKEGKNNFEIIGALGIEPIGNPIFNSGETIYVGSTVLTNETNMDQKIRTESFSKDESLITTSKTTDGFKLGIKGGAKFSVRFFENGVEIYTEVSTEYNFSSEKTTTISQTQRLTVPSQEILVPAKSKIQVTAIFNRGFCTGQVLLKGLLRGKDKVNICVYDKYSGKLQYCLGDLVPFDRLAQEGNLPQFKSVPNSFNKETNTGEMEILGVGEYTSSLATNFIINLKQFHSKERGICKSCNYPAKTIFIS